VAFVYLSLSEKTLILEPHMPFILAPIDTIKILCKIEIPLDFGKTKAADIDVTWKYLSVDERQQYIDRLSNSDKPPKDIDILKELIIDIDGLKDDQKQDIEFSESVLEQLAQLAYVRQPLMDQALSVVYGIELAEKMRQKN
jgi:hypothetical protein